MNKVLARVDTTYRGQGTRGLGDFSKGYLVRSADVNGKVLLMIREKCLF